MPDSPRDREFLRLPGFLESLRSGDSEALDRLMDCLWAPLVRYAGQTLPDGSDPQDIVQEAFVRLWTRRATLRQDGSIRALLYTTVRNACLDEIRTSRRRQKLRSIECGPSPSPGPYEDTQGAELHRLAAAAVAKLPERRREVFRLVRAEGMSYREAAEVLGLSEQTVANHMSLALADLRTALRPFISPREAGTKTREEPYPQGNPSGG